DRSLLTGSIDGAGGLHTTVTPRTKGIAPELGAGLAGGLALLAQLGLLALPLRRTRREAEPLVDPTDDPAAPAPLPVEDPSSEAEQDMVFTAMSTEAFAVPVTTIAAEPPVVETPPAPPVMAAPAWHKPEPEPQPQPTP